MQELTLNSDDLIKGLKHYRRIAKQDIVRSGESVDQPWLVDHATARREVYARLTELAEEHDPMRSCKRRLIGTSNCRS